MTNNVEDELTGRQPVMSLTLITKAQRGDQVALHELLVTYHTRLANHVARKIPRRIQGVVSAEDILQQTFLQAMQHIGQFSPRGPQSFYRWLKAIATNCARDTSRRLTSAKRGGNRRQTRKLTRPDESSMADLVEMLSAGGQTPSGSVARHEAIEAVQQSIESLSDEYRQAVQLRLLEGKSLTETATIMSRSPRAVQGLVDRAKKKMRAALGRLSLYE